MFQKRAQVDNLDHLFTVPEEVDTGRLKRVVAVFHTHSVTVCIYSYINTIMVSKGKRGIYVRYINILDISLTAL